MVLALVVAAGGAPEPSALRSVEADLVVAVDGGLAALRRAEIVPTLLVGDMDSSVSQDREWALSLGATVHAFPAAKDSTDLELALGAAVDSGADHLLVMGTAGGRGDHVLGNWAALAAVRAARVEVRSDDSTAHLVHSRIVLYGAAGDPVSIIPWGGTAIVSTAGLRWPLDRATLSPFEALGISNEFVGEEATITIDEGVVIVVRPLI